MIFVPYQQSVSLAQGVDALQDYQRLKLQKALSMIQLGSQFGDKGALAQGFSMMGLEDTAMKYREPDVIDALKKEAVKEEGLKIATDAALATYGKSYAQDAEDARIQLATKLAAKKDNKGQIITDKEGNPVIDKKLYDKYINDEKLLLKEANRGDAENAQLLSKIERFGKNKELLKSAYYGHTVPTEEEEAYRINNAVKNLPLKVLTKQENIDKYILGAKDQPEAINRLRDTVTAVIQKKGGLDMEDVIKFQETEKALSRLYGQEYRPIFNYSAMLKGVRSGGTGGKKDYVLMKNGKVVFQGSFANADEAQAFAKKKGYANALIIQGTAEKAQNVLSKALETIRNPIALEAAGLEYKGFFGGKKFKDKETGEVISYDEALRRVMLIQSSENEDSDIEYERFTQLKAKK